jgi:hypothetical protein
LERLGVGSGTAFFPELSRESEAVFFPYQAAGELVNFKAAAFPVKAFTSKKGGKLQFWNIERVIGSPTVFITEGEWDAAALVEAGIPVEQVISVPNGARQRASGDDDKPKGYAYVEEACATDSTGPSASSGAATTTGQAIRCAPTWSNSLAPPASTSWSGLKDARTPTTISAARDHKRCTSWSQKARCRGQWKASTGSASYLSPLRSPCGIRVFRSGRVKSDWRRGH